MAEDSSGDKVHRADGGGSVDPYDRVAFASKPSRDKHPDRIAVIAALRGFAACPVDSARVLELGCGSGATLLPLAMEFPDSEFVGIDVAARQLEVGAKHIAAVGVKNIALQKADLKSYEIETAGFDYIICHGVFSWVEPTLQERLLELVASGLRPQGIAMLSYNCSPGWDMRSRARELLALGDNPLAAPEERIGAARNALSFFTTRLVDAVSPYALQLKGELDQLTRQSDGFVYHELLQEVDRAVTLSEFLGRAGYHGLHYLGDARPGRNRAHLFCDPTQGETASCFEVQGQELREQYMDYLFPLSFRTSLLTKASVPEKILIEFEQLAEWHASSPLVPTDDTDDPRRESTQAYCGPAEEIVEVSKPLIKCALAVLHEVWPGAKSISELLKQARSKLGDCAPDVNSSQQQLTRALLEQFHRGQVELYQSPPKVRCEVSEQPATSPYARQQAVEQDWATNQRYEYLPLDAVERMLVTLLDGTRDREQLIRALDLQLYERGMRIAHEGCELTESSERATLLGEQVDQTLAKLAEAGFLIR